MRAWRLVTMVLVHQGGGDVVCGTRSCFMGVWKLKGFAWEGSVVNVFTCTFVDCGVCVLCWTEPRQIKSES